MFEIEKNEEIQHLIQITKSNSGISGPELARAHFKLGALLAQNIRLDPEETTIIAMLRGGIFFAEGMYFEMGCKFDLYDPKCQVFIRPPTKNVILVDSVINTGSTIRKIMDEDMYVACCVINRKAVALFDKKL